MILNAIILYLAYFIQKYLLRDEHKSCTRNKKYCFDKVIGLLGNTALAHREFRKSALPSETTVRRKMLKGKLRN